MREVYVYDEFCEDFDNLGIVGALTPTSCEHEEIAGGMSEVILVHPIDEVGKYKGLEKGRILKATVPVRTTPEIDGTTMVTTVWKYHVKASSSKEQRKVWSKREEGKKLGSLKANQEVVVVKRNDAWNRYKIKAKKLNGWIDKAALEEDATVQLPGDDPTAIEDIYPLWGDKEQLFRIYSEDRTDTEITVHARHISYDLLTNMTMYKNNQEVSLADAVNGVFNQCVESHEFTVQTNIADTKVGVDYRHSNPINALFDPETGILKKWDVQLVRDDYELTILKTVGKNRGMTVEYGRNLTGVNCNISTENVVTCVLPTGVDHDGNPLYLTDNVLVNGQPNPNNYVFAKQSIRDMYPFEHIYHLECEDCTEGSEEADDKNNTYRPTKAKVRERMLEQAREVLWEDKDHYGADDQASANTMPTVSLQVQFVTLGDTEEYKQFKDLERLFLYDKVRVRVPKLNIDMVLDAVRVKTDCITGKTIEVEIGALTDIEVSIPSWAITSLNGGKIVAGSIPAGSFGKGVISADAIFANAITADKIASNSISTRTLQAESVTADKIAAGTITADKFEGQYADFETLVTDNLTADSVATKFLQADEGYFQTLGAEVGEFVEISAGQITSGTIAANLISAGSISADKLDAQAASIDDLVARHISTSVVDADHIDATNISTTNLGAAIATISEAVISEASIAVANIDFANMTQAEVQKLNAAMLTADKASLSQAGIDTANINSLYAAYAAVADARVSSATIDIAHIDLANITNAQITDLSAYFAHINQGTLTNLYASGIYSDSTETNTLVAQDGYITNALIHNLTASNIQAGAITADRLLLRDSVNGLIYALNASAEGITPQQLTEEEYQEYLHGASIMAQTITGTESFDENGDPIPGHIKLASIDAVDIKAHTITTDQLTSNIGYSLDISSNESITSLAGSITDAHTLIAQDAVMITSLVTSTDGLTSRVEQTESDISVSVSRLDDIDGTLTPYKAWLNFDANDFLTIGKGGSEFSVQITNDALNFNRGANPVAWMNTENFYITDGEIRNSLTIGRFRFVPQTNGNMSIIYNVTNQ